MEERHRETKDRLEFALDFIYLGSARVVHLLVYLLVHQWHVPWIVEAQTHIVFAE